MMKDTKEKLGGLTVGLHWLVGLTTIVLLAVGMYMTKYEAGSLYPIHKSIGISIVIKTHKSESRQMCEKKGSGMQPLAVLGSDMSVREAVNRINDTILNINPVDILEVLDEQNKLTIGGSFYIYIRSD